MTSYFIADETAINQSWVCFNEMDIEGNDTETCIYITLQQFHRTSQLLSYVEAFVFLFLAFLIIPANIWAIYRFKAKRLNKEFFILIFALCCYNFMNVFVTMVYGWARATQFIFPLGYFGCFITTVFAPIIANATSFTFALISYERRSLILFRKGLHRPSRTIYVVVLLVFIFTFCVAFWLGIFIYPDILVVLRYPIYKDPLPESELCLGLTYKIGPIPPEFLFGFFHFLLPLSIVIYNYT